MKICVAGVGKPWATDDAVGPTIVRQLASRFEAAPPATGVDLAFTTSSEPAVDLLHLMEGADQVIIIDAVRSGAPPGIIHRQVWLPGLIESRGVERASSHGLGVREILALAAELGRLPDQVFLWGVEVVSTEPGYGLSPPVAAVLPNVVEQFSQILAIYLKAALERGKS